MLTEITALSSKGQIVLPKSVRNSLGLKKGTKFVVFADGDNILLKPIKHPDTEDFKAVIKRAQEWAAQEDGAKEEQAAPIKKARAAKKVEENGD